MYDECYFRELYDAASDNMRGAMGRRLHVWIKGLAAAGSNTYWSFSPREVVQVLWRVHLPETDRYHESWSSIVVTRSGLVVYCAAYLILAGVDRPWLDANVHVGDSAADVLRIAYISEVDFERVGLSTTKLFTDFPHKEIRSLEEIAMHQQMCEEFLKI